MRPRHPRKAFTLIELLVVIAIIVMLVAILLPALQWAKEITRFVICKSYMGQTATAWFGFAASHQDRLAGQGASTYEEQPVCWPQILNREFWGGNQPNQYPTETYPPYPPYGPYGYGDEPPIVGPLLKFWDFWSPPEGTYPPIYNPAYLGRKYMNCPNYQAWESGGNSNIWSRPLLVNSHAEGGQYNPGAEALTDPTSAWYEDGLVLSNTQIPNQCYYNPPISANPQCSTAPYYELGRRTDTWANASIKYLVWESEAGDDMNGWNGGGGPNGTVPLNTDGSDSTKAPWCNNVQVPYSGEFAFRHLLKTDQNLWQEQARMPVLYVDGHVGEWNPSAPQYAQQYFLPGS